MAGRIQTHPRTQGLRRLNQNWFLHRNMVLTRTQMKYPGVLTMQFKIDLNDVYFVYLLNEAIWK